ncbi:MAG: carbon storage regulator [Pirellulales bacterium]
MGLLVLDRALMEEIIIDERIRVVLLKVQGRRARIGIDAPDEMRIRRGEIEARPLSDGPETGDAHAR